MKYLLVCMLGFFSFAANAEEVAAVLEWAKRVELTTPVSGRVEKIKVNVGDTVKKGAVLLSLDQREFKGNVVQAQAGKVKAEEKFAEARRELERAKELFDRTVISVHELQLVKIAYATANAELSEAQAKLNLARLHLEYSTLRAPFNARVIGRSVEVGQTVVTRLQATPLLVLAAKGHMIARAKVSGDVLDRVSPGKNIKVKVGGKSYNAMVKNMGQEPVKGSGKQALYTLDAEFPVDGHYRKGQPAVIVLP